MHCTYHPLGGPIVIAPCEKSVGKHNGRDDTCVAAKATPPFFNVTANVKRLVREGIGGGMRMQACSILL